MQKHTSKNAEKYWHIKKNQQSQWIAGFVFLAGDEGFEPPQTESESGVLPLHKSPVYAAPKCMYHYMHLRKNVKSIFSVVAKIKLRLETASAACFSMYAVIFRLRSAMAAQTGAWEKKGRKSC